MRGRVLKTCANQLAPVLAKIFNTSLAQAVLPTTTAHYFWNTTNQWPSFGAKTSAGPDTLGTTGSKNPSSTTTTSRSQLPSCRNFCSSAVERFLTGCITARNQVTPQRARCVQRDRIIRASLPALKNTYTKRGSMRAQKMTRDATLLRSGTYLCSPKRDHREVSSLRPYTFYTQAPKITTTTTMHTADMGKSKWE